MAARRALRVLLLVAAAVVLAASVIGAPPAAAASSWGWPLPDPHRVVRGFEPPAHDWLPGHRGVDLAGEVGEQVLAAGPGRVVVSGPVAGVGVVTVRHADGLVTTYQPVRAAVPAGVQVSAGTLLGRLVLAHGHCLPAACLHWGLLRDGRYLDPLALVGAGRVRLLPPLHAAGTGSWVVPAASGASVGSSAVVLGWAVAVTRRRRRPVPPGVTRLDDVRARRRDPPRPP